MKKALIIIAAICMFNVFYTNYTFNTIEEEIEEIKTDISEYKSFMVTATMYNPVESQCDSDPLVTAGMYRIDPENASEHRWIAVSRNLLKRWGGIFDYGDKVQITGAGHKDGVYTIVDTMNKRFMDRIDFLETSGTKWYKFNNVQITSL